MDVGTGGGFPGIPLAILFPEVRFTLVDSVGKKIKVAQAVVDGIGLENVRVLNCRVEDMDRKEKFDLEQDRYDWIMDMRTTRNNPYHILVPRELEYLANPADEEYQTVLWEALGWYNLSYQAPVIAAAAMKVAEDERFPEKVRQEALKTYNRTK